MLLPMLGSKRSAWMLSLLVAALAIGTNACVASATTICVPAFTSACPNSAGNVAKADLEEALSFQGSDGKADEVRIAAGTFTENGGFEPAGGSATSLELTGSDPLTIVGAGPAATILTSASTSNNYAVNFDFNGSRELMVRGLTLQAPASMPDGEGAVVQLGKGNTLDNVNIVSLNPGSDGVSAGRSGAVFRNGEVRGGGASGSIADGLTASSDGASFLIEDSTVRGASWALYTGGSSTALTARRVAVVGARTYGGIDTGGALKIENSTITIDDGIGLYVSANTSNSTLNADHVTVVNSGGTDPALEGKKFGNGAGNGTLVATNSIFRGFGSGYKTETAFGPGIGVISLTARYSNLPKGESTAGGVVDSSLGNIDVDPQLAADFSLPPGSLSVDAGDPAAGGLTTDFLNATRPTDGNGDGIARRDQGAFEYQPPPAVVLRSAEEPDVTPPDTKIKKGPGARLAKGEAKFSFGASETPARFACKLDGHKAGGCKSPRSYKHLKPGRHVFKVWAIDRAGNQDPSPAKRRFLVPA
jgi:hypothetical protein